MLEVIILLITYKVCATSKTEDLNLSVLNVVAGINESKELTKHISCISHANVNVDLIEENVIQINGGIMININVSANNVIYVEKIIFGILLHVVMKMENI